MAFIVEEDVAFDPANIGLLGADGIVFEADSLADLIYRCSDNDCDIA
jgi:hypothetical protein